MRHGAVVEGLLIGEKFIKSERVAWIVVPSTFSTASFHFSAIIIYIAFPVLSSMPTKRLCRFEDTPGRKFPYLWTRNS